MSASEVLRTGLNLILDHARIEDPGPVGEGETPAPPSFGQMLAAVLRERDGRPDGATPAADDGGSGRDAAPQGES